MAWTSRTDFPALPGWYQTLFLHLEPISTISPAFICWFLPGATWFHHQLIPTDAPSPPPGFLDPRTSLALWQLGSCYLLLGLLSALVFRAVRDALPHDPVAQERILGASLTALAIADVTHIAATLIGLPPDLRFDPSRWNAMTHGNISAVIVLLGGRLAWFAGLGRRRYYYGTDKKTVKVS